MHFTSLQIFAIVYIISSLLTRASMIDMLKNVSPENKYYEDIQKAKNVLLKFHWVPVLNTLIAAPYIFLWAIGFVFRIAKKKDNNKPPIKPFDNETTS